MKKQFLRLCACVALLVGFSGQASAYIFSLNDLSSTNNYYYSVVGLEGTTYSGNYTLSTYQDPITGNYAWGDLAGTPLNGVNNDGIVNGYEWASTLVDTNLTLYAANKTTRLDGWGTYKGAETKAPWTYMLGAPDLIGTDGVARHEAGGSSGVNGYQSADSWFVLGFNNALDASQGLYIDSVNVGATADSMHIYVSTDSTYDSSMTWVDLGGLLGSSSPVPDSFLFGQTIASTGQEQFISGSAIEAALAAAGVTGDITYVELVGNGHWIDGVGGTAVPIPGAAILMGSGLLCLVGIRRRITPGA